MSEWQNISTAPEEEYVLVSVGGVIPFVAMYDPDPGEWHSFNMHYEHTIQTHTNKPFAPTHWMPLPPVPLAEPLAGENPGQSENPAK